MREERLEININKEGYINTKVLYSFAEKKCVKRIDKAQKFRYDKDEFGSP